VCEVVKQLEGAYALLIKSSVYPGELVACRRGSPLILGMKYGIQVGGRRARAGWRWVVGACSVGKEWVVLPVCTASVHSQGSTPFPCFPGADIIATLLCILLLALLQAAATPRTPQSPNTPLTPKLTGTSTHGPQFFDNAAPAGAQNQPYGLELFLASEASAVVEHTKQ